MIMLTSGCPASQVNNGGKKKRPATYKSLPPLVNVCFSQGAYNPRRAGIVDENVELTGLSEQIGHGIGIRDVGRHGIHVTVGKLGQDSRLGVIKVLGVAAGEDNGG